MIQTDVHLTFNRIQVFGSQVFQINLFLRKSIKYTNMEQLQTALGAVKVLRTTVGQVFETLGSGIRAEHGEDGETKFIHEIQELLTATNTQLR